MGGWPGKSWLTIGVIVAIAASSLLYFRWRVPPLLVGAVASATIFVWPSFRFGWDAAGLKIGGLSFGNATTALIIAALAISAAQLWKLASSPRLPRWVRFVPPALAFYAIALIVFGIAHGTAASAVLSATGWLPWWMSGAYLGGAVLRPA